MGHSEQDLISNFSEVEKTYCDRFQPNYSAIFLEQETEKKYRADKIKWALDQVEKLPLMALVGVRAEESINRCRSLSKYGKIHQYKAGKWRAYPLSNWQWIDVWAYTTINNLPYLSAYDKIAKDSPKSRTALHFGRSANSALSVERWEQFKLTSPEFVQYVKENYYADWL